MFSSVKPVTEGKGPPPFTHGPLDSLGSDAWTMMPYWHRMVQGRQAAIKQDTALVTNLTILRIQMVRTLSCEDHLNPDLALPAVFLCQAN